MKKLLSIVAFAGLSIASFAQTSKLEQDKKSILDMQGCYKVEFRYAEIFSPDTAYNFTDREYVWSYEWITPIKVEDKFVSLQHLLTVNDSTVVKHWRQDWTFEGNEFHNYVTDYTWERVNRQQPKGQWKQEVTQVDDSPRYAGTGTWVHVDGKHYWESEAPAPLPRRELKKKRKDYNVLVRGNRHEITENGWIHDQDNQKVQVSEDGTKNVIAIEKGWNTYEKVDMANCQPSVEYWEKTNRFWSHVRMAWADVMKNNNKFHVDVKNENGVLYASMFKMAKESQDWSDKKMIKEISKTIANHLSVISDELGDNMN